MGQQTLAGTGFERNRKMTRRERFLQEMDRIVPRQRLVDVVAPQYLPDERGRPPVGLVRRLCDYCLGHWYSLSDPALEEALYDMEAMRRFVGIDLGREAAPDETTNCNFLHLLEANDLGAALFAEINTHLANRGVQVSGGTIVDATSIDAPSSTKRQRGERDPEMHQTKKGNQWYFGMESRFGLDSTTKLSPAVVVTAAKTGDGSVVGDLLHGEETRVWGDKAYDGQREAIAAAAPAAQNHIHDKGHRHRRLTGDQEAANRYKLSVRSKVEHPIDTIKRAFGFGKVRYRGIAKKANVRGKRAFESVHGPTTSAGGGYSVFMESMRSGNEPANAVEGGQNEALAAPTPRSPRSFRSSATQRVGDITKLDVP